MNEIENTDREVWRGHDDGRGSYYANSVHITKDGGIGINVAGHVIVKLAREWHKLAIQPQKPEGCAECKWPECGCQNSYTPASPQRSYADRADGATTFDPEAQFEKDNGL